MIAIDSSSALDADLLGRVFAAAGPKIQALAARWADDSGAPVFTADGLYVVRGWTDWTRGFMVGASLLQFEATGDQSFLDLGREQTSRTMVSHLTHTGVHDHGFQNVSTFGNLLRLMAEGGIPSDPWERRAYEIALRVSGAVQANRWTALPEGLGYVHSFNGPHSLFADTIRSMRALVVSDLLGGELLGENDVRVDLLDRVLVHAETTARYNVYFGEGRDIYDRRGRVAHESIFNTTDGAYRCPSTQQGYSPFSTWTRANAWILLGYAEQLEYLATVDEQRFAAHGGKQAVIDRFEGTARAAADFYIETSPTDGIPYWDTGAPGLRPEDADCPANPFHAHEPVDSSAAAIAAQGLLRLGRQTGDARYSAAGRTVLRTLLTDTYLSSDEGHEGLLLHSVYHRPNGWDHEPGGRGASGRVPRGEATMWGDYHLLELALLAQREVQGKPWLTFFNVVDQQ